MRWGREEEGRGKDDDEKAKPAAGDKGQTAAKEKQTKKK